MGKIKEKQKQYKNLLSNMSSGKLPPAVLEDVGAEMNALKAEIEALEKAEPPKDYTVDTVGGWLNSLKAATDDKAIHLLIERIEVSKNEETTEVNVFSTLNSVAGKNGCGRGI